MEKTIISPDRNNTPLISVIVPSFNYAHFLPETLESVISQTYQNWECVVVDDGSTDNTREVADRYINKDSRFVYVYKENGGLSSARNAGLRKCSGDFIQFLDSDDMLSKLKFENQINIFNENTEVEIVYAGVKFFKSDKSNKIIWVDVADSSGKLQESGCGFVMQSSLIRQNGFVVNAPLVKKSMFNKNGFFDEKLKSVEDWDFWLRCAFSGTCFRYDPSEDSCALVRVHESSMSTNVDRMIRASIIVREKMEKYFLSATDLTGMDELRRLNKDIAESLRQRLKGDSVVNRKQSIGVYGRIRGLRFAQWLIRLLKRVIK